MSQKWSESHFYSPLPGKNELSQRPVNKGLNQNTCVVTTIYNFKSLGHDCICQTMKSFAINTRINETERLSSKSRFSSPVMEKKANSRAYRLKNPNEYTNKQTDRTLILPVN